MQDRGKLRQARAGCSRTAGKDACAPEMITFQISGYLTEFTGGRAEIILKTSPANVREALDSLWSEHVGLRDRVLNELGEVGPHVNVFVKRQTVPRVMIWQTEFLAAT